MKKILLLCAGSLLSVFSVSAQIKFDKLEHDFGTFDEGQPSSVKFAFKNVGKTPATLQQVRASCGCTTPQYTRQSIAPGDTGSVLVSYNSKGRPGMFTKTVTVVYDTSQAPIILQIKGDVKSAPQQPANPAGGQPHNHHGHDHDHHGHDHGHDHNHDHHSHNHNPTPTPTDPKANLTGQIQASPVTNQPNVVGGKKTMQVVPLGNNGQAGPQVIQGGKTEPVTNVVQPSKLPAYRQPTLVMYQDSIGGLAFDNLHQLGQNLSNDKDKDYTIQVRNVTPNAITFTDKIEGKSCFKLAFEPKKLNSGQEGKIKLTFVASQAEPAKLATAFKESVTFYTDEKTENRKNIVVEGMYQKKLTAEEIANGPKMTFNSQDFDAGEILAGEDLVHKYQFTNTGKSDLVIESAKASCGCTVPELKEKLLKPGQSSYIEAKFNSTGRTGPQHKTITVVSNDPSNPRITLNLKCTVKEDPFGAGEEKKLPLNDTGAPRQANY